MIEKSRSLKVVELCGLHCVGVEDGASLFEQMSEVLKSGLALAIDFSQILTITSSFLSASVGRLYGQFDSNDLDKRLTWTALDEDDAELMKLVIRNAKEHFAKSPEARQAEDDIINGAVEEEEHDGA